MMAPVPLNTPLAKNKVFGAGLQASASGTTPGKAAAFAAACNRISPLGSHVSLSQSSASPSRLAATISSPERGCILGCLFRGSSFLVLV